MAIPQWCTIEQASAWVPEFADDGAMGGIATPNWNVVIQNATWEVMQKMQNRYGALVVDVLAVPDSLSQWASVVAARIASQSRNVGGVDDRVDRLLTESLRFEKLAVSGSLLGIDPTYSPNAVAKEYGVGSLVGTTVEQRMTIFEICQGPGPWGVETFNGSY